MTARIKIRRDTAANWVDNNPTLAAGELGLDTTVNQLKVGDGTTPWEDLGYASGGGDSNLTFGTEDLGFYTFALPTNDYGSSYIHAVAADSLGVGTNAKVIYAVGQYYDDGEGWDLGLITKINADDTVAWTKSVRNSGNNSDFIPTSIVWDSIENKLFVAGNTYNGTATVAITLEINPLTGAIINQKTRYPSDGSTSTTRITEMLIDPTDGSLILLGETWSVPVKNAVTPLDNDSFQSVSSNGTEFDPIGSSSLLVVNKSDFTTYGFTPEPTQGSGTWRLFDLSNPTDQGEDASVINQFRNLPTVTLTGTGAGARVNLRYDITNTRWYRAEQFGMDGPGAGGIYEYKIGDTLKVLGSEFGGVDGDDDVILTINYASNDPNNNNSQIEFVELYKQSGVNPTPPSFVTDYVRLWFYGDYNFAADIGSSTAWAVGRRDNGNSFIHFDSSDDTLEIRGAGGDDQIVSGDIYVDSSDDLAYMYVGGESDDQTPESYGNRAHIYKIKVSDGSQVWARTIDMVDDGDINYGDDVRSVNCDVNGNVYVVSMGRTFESSNYRLIITKIDKDGTQVWQKMQANGTSDWDGWPQGDLDMDNGVLYVAGDAGSGMRFISINTSTGAVNWARDIDFSTTDGYFGSQNQDNTPFVAAASGRIAIGGYSEDYDDVFNGGNRFGILAGLDADQVNALAADEVGRFGPFTLKTIEFSMTNAQGSGIRPDSTHEFIASNALTTTTVTSIGTEDDLIEIDPNDITRSPYKIENVQSITFADGSVQKTAMGGVKNTWTNPNGNVWKIVEWNHAKAITYDYIYSDDFVNFSAKDAISQTDKLTINETVASTAWQYYVNANRVNTKLYKGDRQIRVSSTGIEEDGTITLNLDIPEGEALVDFTDGEGVNIRWGNPANIDPVEWFDPNDSPWGDNQFRGAKIDYHAYSSSFGTIVGTIHFAYDSSDTTQATHTEHFDGDSNLAHVILWEVDGKQLYYRNTAPDTDRVFIQWTATMFYGSENWD